MRKILLLPFLVLLLLNGLAQDRHEAWLRVNLIHWSTPKKGIGLELHQRTQSNYWTEDQNLFRYPMLSIIRPWLYWKINKSWIASYSPISYHGYTTIKNQSGESDSYTELRTTLGIQRNFKLGSLLNRNRAWYEFRFIDIGSDAFSFSTRLRVQNILILPLWKPSEKQQVGYQLANEIFFAQQSSSVSFDHNRLYNALQWKIGKQEINLGYQWSLHKSGATTYDRRQLFFNTNFEL